jgi:hypothetical protein
MSQAIKDREIIAVLEEFVKTQENLLCEFQKQIHPLEDTSLKQPKTGEIVAMNETWKFWKHGVGICFEGNKSGKIVDVHIGITDCKKAFDAWRLAQYLLSTKKYTEIVWHRTYSIADEDGDFNDDDIQKLLEDLKKENVIESVADQSKLYELNPIKCTMPSNLEQVELIQNQNEINEILKILQQATYINKNWFNLNRRFSNRNKNFVKKELAFLKEKIYTKIFVYLSLFVLLFMLILALINYWHQLNNLALLNIIETLRVLVYFTGTAALIENMIAEKAKSTSSKNNHQKQSVTLTRKQAEIKITEFAHNHGIKIIDKSLVVLEEIIKIYDNRIKNILIWFSIIAIGLTTMIIRSYNFDLIRKSGWLYFILLMGTTIVNLWNLSDKNEFAKLVTILKLAKINYASENQE